MIAGWLAWGWPTSQELNQATVMLIGASAAYGISVLLTRRMSLVDMGHAHPMMEVAITAAAFGILSVALLLTRTYYSRSFLLAAAFLALLWIVGGRLLKHRLFRPTFAVEPRAVRPSILSKRAVNWVPIDRPALPLNPVDAVVANRQVTDPDWQRFHTQCAVSGVPILDGPLVSERLSGRVSIEWLSGDYAASFQPHAFYAPFKRALDIILVVILAPLLALLGSIVALAIKLDSPGPVFFIQNRVGEAGSVFPMIKFRSMHVDAELEGARFAAEDDDRITRVGRLIRRMRLDELPQFWNVLKGQMSLIGPRPEQPGFVEQFEAAIPFYGYRHLVKPGITGWAQVAHGYAASEDETRDKLEYDLYYAKNCSLWLDLVVAIRTLKIIATGFGAR